MSRTYRNIPKDKTVRKPKRNRARKEEVRPGAYPPNDWDDLEIAAFQEDWHSKTKNNKVGHRSEQWTVRNRRKNPPKEKFLEENL